MNLWLVLIAAGLGAMKVTELLKEAVPWPLQPWTKSALSILLAFGGCAASGVTGERLATLSLGSAGLAALAHEVAGVLGMASDWFKQQIILRSTTRRR